MRMQMPRLLSLASLVLAALIQPCQSAETAKPEAKELEPSQFLRLSRGDDDELAALETAIIRYAPRDAQRKGLVVDLIGVVHVGEADYYAELNRRFRGYDALLFELVAPEGTKIEKGERSGGGHPVGMLQDGLKNLLGLEHQLSHIDYQKDNFVHADMSPDEFSRRMNERGESFLGMYFRMIGHSMAQQPKASGSSDINLLMALFSKNRSLAIKRAMAMEFEDIEGTMTAFEGPDGSTIISERNKKALDVLESQILDGKKRIGIFYGAGHMPDLEERLVKVYGLSPVRQWWLTAWDLSTAPDGKE